MNASALLPILFCIMPQLALAQGFAELGQTAEGYALPDPTTRFTFPDDHGAHREFRIEWWYVTANLRDADGTEYGIQWTLFRNALSPSGRPEDQAWMGHAAVATPAGHLFAERLARGGIGQAGVTAAPFEAFIDEWRMAGPDLANVSVTAQSHEFRYDLDLSSEGPLVPQGEHGFSVKSTVGQASHYYSQPFYSVTGTLSLPEGEAHVTGRAWLDREWYSQALALDQTGWDWISLHLPDGEKLMGYRLRDRTGGTYVFGTWIAADGSPEPLRVGSLEMTPVEWAEVAGRQLPVAWDIAHGARGIAIRAEAIYPQSWMGTLIPYWEGPVRASGSHSGEGYLELTGY
ncbi:MAG: iron ABC transporter permease [Boseongicola sp. SB0677_bin_26]|nr:iron ABC transporter permease [Boseongicola sp. SB0665_bin_10]MYG24486.1 iron ABC transporter permease [Boseongicola sp. SB0677_bin_26]